MRRPALPSAKSSLFARPALALIAGSYAFRLPPLLNARSTNSDAAVVGLQAMHLLRGELSPFLWGSGYQTSADSFVAAVFFLVLGATPFALMMSALTLHVAATLFVFATLRREFAPWTAALLTMPLVVSPSSVHTYALYPPRQASLTLALAALWAIARAANEPSMNTFSERVHRSAVWLAAGGLLSTLAVGADPYPLLLVPVTGALALMIAGRRARLLGAYAGGAAVGLVPFLLLHAMQRSTGGQMAFTLSMLDHHWKLLVRECLPWALSYKVYYAYNVMDYGPWNAPLAFDVIAGAGAALLGGMVLYAPWARVPWPVKRLGVAGALAWAFALGGFMVSVMVMDHFSMRYLAVLTLTAPFAVAPAARALGTKRFAIAFAPHLVASAIGGWVGYGPFVHGVVPVREAPELADDYALFDALASRGVTYATADYWTSYRLTFLSREKLIVVPTNRAEDRYAPYRDALKAAPVWAYVFDPGRSRERLADVNAGGLDGPAKNVEEVHAGKLTAYVVTR